MQPTSHYKLRLLERDVSTLHDEPAQPAWHARRNPVRITLSQDHVQREWVTRLRPPIVSRLRSRRSRASLKRPLELMPE